MTPSSRPQTSSPTMRPDDHQTAAPVGGDDDDCPLCGGTGEVQATTKRAEQDLIGCPWCIEEDYKERLAELEAKVGSLAIAPASADTSDAAVPVAWRVRHGDRPSWSYMEINPGLPGGYWTEVAPLYASAPPPPAPVGLRIVLKPLDGPGTEFVEIEDATGHSVKLPWIERPDGLFEIRVGSQTPPPAPIGLVDAVRDRDGLADSLARDVAGLLGRTYSTAEHADIQGAVREAVERAAALSAQAGAPAGVGRSKLPPVEKWGDPLFRPTNAEIVDDALQQFAVTLSGQTGGAVPAGALEKLRALSAEAQSGRWHTNENHKTILGEPTEDDETLFYDVARAPYRATRDRDAWRQWMADKAFIVAAVNFVRARLAAQSGGSPAGVGDLRDAVIGAARNVYDGLKDGFVRCERCGDQETTGDLDGVPDLGRALAALDAARFATPNGSEG